MIFLKEPTQCHLWKEENMPSNDKEMADNFDDVRAFEDLDEPDVDRLVCKCNQCGQTYFYEILNMWNGSVYVNIIPVENEKEAEKMKNLSRYDILKYVPRIEDGASVGEKRTGYRWLKREHRTDAEWDATADDIDKRIKIVKGLYVKAKADFEDRIAGEKQSTNQSAFAKSDLNC
ncbi:MAG: hypothetical protein A2374_05330 [Candidatus Moranbacteria bacterium RIFOXYB1_FULL_44_23]|nr:MAG: hypothetical protein A2407_04575 [Candidatus Moranbacteria bacterium RIFOXYC1_FULL_44_8]OGI40182.1 MAG: hypothetical protein A2374_05330 [Candidatus Moranbacteria bacterium RIFOXYB1_FULL_44_23]HBB37251.1 hypothetical protein [Candidatus Moranbacteria bacterium]HBU25183.1 hypothetical protein [Candidatus Moranbacteria bacterium]